jgi:asparagine synthase (glutamine-hydrolysing)
MEHILPRLVWHLEEPRVGMSYQNFYISQLASKFVRVVLAGVGGDELFGGYPWRYGFSSSSDYFRYWQRVVPVAERSQCYTPDVHALIRQQDLEGVFRDAVCGDTDANSNQPLTHGQVLAFEARTFLHGLLLIEDRIAMASSLETRVPFLDNDLVDLVQHLPHAYRLGPESRILGGPGLPDDPEGTVSSKYVLREAMKGLVPPEILARRKQGFSPPDGSWYRGPTMEYVGRILLDPRSLARGLIRPEYVRRLVSEHTSGRRNHRLAIWSLLNIEWWHRIFCDDGGRAWREPPGPEIH